MKVHCRVCGARFEAKRSTARFCGPACRKRQGRRDGVTQVRVDDFLTANFVTLNVVENKGEILAKIDEFPVFATRYFEVRRLADEAPEIGSGLGRVFVLAEIGDQHGAEAFDSVTIFSPAGGAVATIGRTIWRSLRPRLIDEYDLDRMRQLLSEDRHTAWERHRARRSVTFDEAPEAVMS
jgi:hypothetical protein